MQRSNILTVEIPNVDLTLSYFNYDKDLLYNLREDYGKTHAFFRHRVDNEDIILVFPILNKPDIKIEGASEIIVNPSKNMFLAKKFIHELIFRKVLGSGAAVEKYTDIKFLSRKTTDNKLSQILSTDIQIGFKKGYEITSRIFL